MAFAIVLFAVLAMMKGGGNYTAFNLIFFFANNFKSVDISKIIRTFAVVGIKRIL
jgi:hypothetical protein